MRRAFSLVALYKEKLVFYNLFLIRNEEEVGEALKKCGIPRDQIYISTKVYICSVHPLELGNIALD